MINHAAIEARWQKAWADAKVFEVEPNEKPALLVTAAMPYLDMPQHVGHLRTYGTADAYARYMRMRGYNVLYPMAFHATGTPVIAIAKRVGTGDPDILDTLKLFGVPDEEVKKMVEPVYITKYFENEMRRGMVAAGYGIDWRCSFTSIDPLFSKMVEWQFMRLHDLGFLATGAHPVGWCTNEGNAVGQHDTHGDVQPKIEKLVAIKFKDSGSGVFFPCLTYRPETVYGVTNIFINESAKYVVAEIAGSTCYLSEASAKALAEQTSVRVISAIQTSELLKKKAINPLTKEEVPVLPGFFVKEDTGTGVVMSVPAHAPFDYAALMRLKISGHALPEMQYRRVLRIEGRPDDEALFENVRTIGHAEAIRIGDSTTEADLELATKAVYSEEARRGVMLVGKYAGSREPEAREAIAKDLIDAGQAFRVYALANEEQVICRCGTKVIVKVVTDQWFINYGDEKWKASVKKHLLRMKLLPKNTVNLYAATVDWIDERAAERAQGLGTRFPFNPEHIIESLSDSTIYMCFYTFAHTLRTYGVKPEQLKPEFFNYVVEGSGSVSATAAATGIDASVLKKCKDSFDYWYTFTSRHSATDLIPNHLTMYVFNHVALMKEEHWPKQIVANALVNYEGEKMSKSLGNIVPLIEGVRKYGADSMRMVEIAGAELGSVTNFSVEAMNGVDERSEFLYRTVADIPSLQAGALGHIDYWLYSRLNTKIKAATASMDELRFRAAYDDIFYGSVLELRHYFARGGANAVVVNDYMRAITIMLAPVMPHFAEELWHMLGASGLVVQEQWPAADEAMINSEAEEFEDMLDAIVSDISTAKEMTSRMEANKGKSIRRIAVIVAADWKSAAQNAFVELRDIGRVMAMRELADVDRETLSKALAQFAKKGRELTRTRAGTASSTRPALDEARQYIAGQLSLGPGVQIAVELETESRSARAGRAMPGKPSIDIQWG